MFLVIDLEKNNQFNLKIQTETENFERTLDEEKNVFQLEFIPLQNHMREYSVKSPIKDKKIGGKNPSFFFSLGRKMETLIQTLVPNGDIVPQFPNSRAWILV